MAGTQLEDGTDYPVSSEPRLLLPEQLEMERKSHVWEPSGKHEEANEPNRISSCHSAGATEIGVRVTCGAW